MDVPERHVSSEMHSSVDNYPLSSPAPRHSPPSCIENDAFKGSNLRVIGISPDSVQEQDAFVKKQKLTVSAPKIQRPTTVGSNPVWFTVSSAERLGWRVP